MMWLLRKRLLIFACVVLSGTALLYVSQNVQDVQRELSATRIKITQEKNRLRVLKAEWAYLNSPLYLEQVAAQVLELEPVDDKQFLSDPSIVPLTPPPAGVKPDFSAYVQTISASYPSFGLEGGND